MIKTTKQIIVDELNFDGDKGLSSVEFCKSVDECKSLQKCWVGLNELKKEIIRIIDNEAPLHTEKECLRCRLNYAFDILCNSSEQNDTVRISESVVDSAEGEKSPSGIIHKKCTCDKSLPLRTQDICGRCGGVL